MCVCVCVCVCVHSLHTETRVLGNFIFMRWLSCGVLCTSIYTWLVPVSCLAYCGRGSCSPSMAIYSISIFIRPIIAEKREERGGWSRDMEGDKSNLKGYYPSQMLWVINSDLLCWALLGVGTALSGTWPSFPFPGAWTTYKGTPACSLHAAVYNHWTTTGLTFFCTKNHFYDF